MWVNRIKETLAIISISILVAISIVGCSPSTSSTATDNSTSSSSANEASGSGQTKAAEIKIGETVNVSTDHGDLALSVEGADGASDWNEKGDDTLASGEGYVLLKLNVENVSYKPEWEDDSLEISDVVSFIDADGFTIDPVSSGWDYGNYTVAIGGHAIIGEGQKKKVAIPYIVSESTSEAEVNINGEYVCKVAIEGDDGGKGADVESSSSNADEDEEQLVNENADEVSEETEQESAKAYNTTNVVSNDADSSADKGTAMAKYAGAMPGYLNDLADCIDVAKNAASSGDVPTAKAAFDKAENIYETVSTMSVPSDAKKVHELALEAVIDMHDATSSFYDAAVSKSNGDSAGYSENVYWAEDFMRLAKSDLDALTPAIKELQQSYSS